MQGWKTLIFALLVIVFGALETFDFTAYLDTQTAGVITILIGTITAILRLLTKGPVNFRKGPSDDPKV